VTILVFKSEIC